MAGYYNPNFGQEYLAARGIGPQTLNTNQKQPVAPTGSNAPVQPINSWSDALDSITKPYTDQINSIKQTVGNLSNAASQLGQGNMWNAVNAARGVPTPEAAAAPAAADTIPGAVNFESSVTPLADASSDALAAVLA